MGGALAMAVALFAEFEQHLEVWLAASGLGAARLALHAQDDGCPCGADLGLLDNIWAASPAASPCRLQKEVQVLALAGAGSRPSPCLLCIGCSVAGGSTCVLQVGFAGGLEDLSEAAGFVRLAAPLLIWARTLLEKRRLEESLETELRQAITAQDEQQEWIALEVHDRVAQTLVSVFQQLQILEDLARPYPEIFQAAARGSLLCREAIREARNIMNDLRPIVLNEFGMVPAMEEELRQLAEAGTVRVKKTFLLVGRLPRGLELTLYRIFREALVNIQRHAEATDVEVVLRDDGAGVRLEVSDDGRGFDVQEAMAKERVGGLLSMRRRAEVAGGTWQVKSESGRGTRVNAWLPLPPQLDSVASRALGWRP